MQAPFQHYDSLSFLTAIRDKYKTNITISIGDSTDQHTLSKYCPDPNGRSTADEYSDAMGFMKQLYAEFPTCIEVESNHGRRFRLRAMEAGLSDAYLRPYAEIMQFPKGWCQKEFVEINNVIYEHGERFGTRNCCNQAMMVNNKSTVIGHHHASFQISYSHNRTETIWSMVVGSLIDYSSYAFKYARLNKFFPILGTGIVVNNMPILIPMVTDKNNRWIGVL